LRGNALGDLNFIAHPFLLVFAGSFGRPLRLWIVRILHYAGGVDFDRLYLSRLGYHILLGEDLSQKPYLFTLSQFGRAGL
jgi:hypothetical protein